MTYSNFTGLQIVLYLEASSNLEAFGYTSCLVFVHGYLNKMNRFHLVLSQILHKFVMQDCLK